MTDTSFRAGKIEDGYVYGYLFKSSLFNGRIVLDAGEMEYRTNAAEVWKDEGYVQVDNLNALSNSELTGSRARIPVSQITEKKVSRIPRGIK